MAEDSIQLEAAVGSMSVLAPTCQHQSSLSVPPLAVACLHLRGVTASRPPREDGDVNRKTWKDGCIRTKPTQLVPCAHKTLRKITVSPRENDDSGRCPPFLSHSSDQR